MSGDEVLLLADGAVGPSRPRRRWWWPALLVAAGVVAVNGAGWALQRAAEDRARLPGVRIVRPSGEVSALAISGTTLYAGGKDGLVAIDMRTMATSEPFADDGPRLGHVHALLAEPDGVLWIGHENGLTRMDGDDVRTLTADDGMPAERVQSLLRRRDGSLLVGTVAGAAVVESDRARRLTGSAELDDLTVFAMHEGEDGTLYLGTYNAPRGGVSVVRGGVWTGIGPESGLPHADVTSFEDAGDGTVWVGTGFHDRGGAARIDPSAPGGPSVVETLTVESGLAGEKVRSMYRDPAGRIWFGSERDGIAVREGGRFVSTITDVEGLSDPEVKCMVRDASGRLWLGTRSGITLMEDSEGVLRR